MKKEELNKIISNDQQKLLNAKLRALGISDKSITNGINEPSEWIPTGVFEIDCLLGKNMAIPTGTLVEFAGQSQSGKTWLAYKFIAECQKRGKRCRNN